MSLEDGPIGRAQELLANMRAGSQSAVEAFSSQVPALASLAEHGNLVAQEMLGGYYLEYASNPALAFQYFRLAATAGSAAAQRAIGHMIMNGIGFDPDPAKAAELFAGAARAGDAIAQYNLGQMYMRGVGVEPDAEAASQFLESAARGGVPAAWAALAELHEANEETAIARGLLSKGAEAGDPKAIKRFANFLRDGVGGERDAVQSVRWYLRLLDFGDGDGVHEAIGLARSMTDAEVLRAAELAGRPSDGQTLLQVVRK